MTRIKGWRPSPATVIASIALLVALGGSSFAAVTAALPRNSVGTAQLKNNAVTSAKVLNGSLLKVDFRAGQLPRGPAGSAGPAGPAGSAGPAGPTGPTGPAGTSAAKAWAVVKSDGTLVRQSGVTSVSRTSNGRYTVGFSSDISSCAWLATATNTGGGTVSGVEIATNKDTNSTVRVSTSFGGAAADEDFAIAVFC